MKTILQKLDYYMSRLFALRSEQGPYRFLIKKWDRITDINLAANILQTEYFRHELIPVPLPIQEISSIVVIAPHQDDETIGAGGSLLLARDANVRIDILFITDGDLPKAPSYIRFEEAKEVCKRLRANMHELGISNYLPRPQLVHLEKLATILKNLAPQVVMVPWLLDWSAKHRLTNHILYLAHKCFGLPNFEIWGYQVHNCLFPNGYVDITDVAPQKRQLLECYKSQILHYERYDHLAMSMCAWNARFITVSNEHPRAKYVEIFFALPRDEHFNLIERFYFRDFMSTYQGEKKVIDGAISIHRFVSKVHDKRV